MGQRITFYDVGPQGQQKPYGDHIYTRRIMVEYQLGNGSWEAFDIIEDRVRELLLNNKQITGFTTYIYNPEDGADGYFSRRFRYLKKISPGVWEYQTYKKFTD